MPTRKKTKRILRVGRSLDSSLASFVERPLPSERELSSFERVIKKEVREQEIDSNLSEIYNDRYGDRVNVKKLKVKKRIPFIFRLFFRLLVIGLLAFAVYRAYLYWFNNSGDVSNLKFKIEAPARVMLGERMSYQVTYHNLTKFRLSHLSLEMQYPDNFIFSSASLSPSTGDYAWNLPDLEPDASFQFTINGRLIAPLDSANVIFGRLTYVPGSFSSQFKKEASASTIINALGFDVHLNYSKTAFLNQNNDLSLVFSNIDKNNLGDFNINFTLPPETNTNIDVTAFNNISSSSKTGVSSSSFKIAQAGGVSWRVIGLSPESGRQEIPINYIVRKKSADPTIRVYLSKKSPDGQSYTFWEKSFRPELVTSDLNLKLALNNSYNDQAVSFGQTLNYSLSYANQSANDYKNVVVMAVLKGDFLDWSSFKDANKAKVNKQTIIWTAEEVPALTDIKPGTIGNIKFSIKLNKFKKTDLGKDMKIVAYGQYSINNKDLENKQNISNIINSQINSNLQLSERILYFNTDNLPVGSGPLPPQVGATSTFRVYWMVNNDLHELSNVHVIMPLPNYVQWADNKTTNVGDLYFDKVSHQVTWDIGRLPLSVSHRNASFDISLKPSNSDRNKILLLSSGSEVSALDTETKSTILEKNKPKTTRLEDDNIANLSNSGIIQ